MTLVKTLGRYIALRFFYATLAVFFLCFMLVFLIDFIEVLRDAGKKNDASLLLVAWITLLRLPSFSEQTLPFATLIGSIGALLLLSRSSELAIIRSAGMSVWQFLAPGLAVALVLGLSAITLYNPLAAAAKARSDRLYAENFGSEKSIMKQKNSGAWLRQDGADGQSIIHAKAVAERGMALAGVTLLQFDRNKKFLERIEAERAALHEGYWRLDNAHVSSPAAEARFHKTYMVSTYLSQLQVTNSIGSLESISFWELPQFIDFAEKAGLSSARYKLQYQLLLAKPLLLAAMVLVAATCSLKAFRFGKIQTMVIAGLSAGFGFFIFAELSRQLGMSGLISSAIAAWAPNVIASLLALTVLLHQEDG